jgi:translation initiation factor 2B subunit (eIF-2B alpha/beta/delta family)
MQFLAAATSSVTGKGRLYHSSASSCEQSRQECVVSSERLLSKYRAQKNNHCHTEVYRHRKNTVTMRYKDVSCQNISVNMENRISTVVISLRRQKQMNIHSHHNPGLIISRLVLCARLINEYNFLSNHDYFPKLCKTATCFLNTSYSA